jgi:hypothetical protein
MLDGEFDVDPYRDRLSILHSGFEPPLTQGAKRNIVQLRIGGSGDRRGAHTAVRINDAGNPDRGVGRPPSGGFP